MPSPSASGFNMVFLDLDNTLTPTRMEKILQVQLGINVYTIYPKLINNLQHSIIAAIDKIKESIANKGERLVIVVVSNANDLWIQQHLHYAEGKNSPKYPLLSKYISENKIDLISAKLEAFTFLQRTMSKQKALGTVKAATHGQNRKKDRWILKYLSFASVILKYKSQFKMNCTRVFSFGDGKDEGSAIYEYANELKIPCIHFDFVSNPTIEQLKEQWDYIGMNFCKLAYAKELNDGSYFHQYRISKLFEADNNPFFTGNYKQLKTISHCFEMWQDSIAADSRHLTVQMLVSAVKIRLFKQEKAKHLKIMICYLMENNDQFFKAWMNIQ